MYDGPDSSGMPSPDVQVGDVIFHRRWGLVPLAITTATRCKWSHVSMVVDFEEDRTPIILDVVERRRIIPLSLREDPAWCIRRPRLPGCVLPSEWFRPDGFPWAQTVLQVVREAMQAHKNRPAVYPWLDLLGYAPLIRHTRLSRWLLRRTESAVCSATVAEAWHSMGFRWFDIRDTVDGQPIPFEVSPSAVDPGIMWRQAERDRWPTIERTA